MVTYCLEAVIFMINLSPLKSGLQVIKMSVPSQELLLADLSGKQTLAFLWPHKELSRRAGLLGS